MVIRDVQCGATLIQALAVPWWTEPSPSCVTVTQSWAVPEPVWLSHAVLNTCGLCGTEPPLSRSRSWPSREHRGSSTRREERASGRKRPVVGTRGAENTVGSGVWRNNADMNLTTIPCDEHFAWVVVEGYAPVRKIERYAPVGKRDFCIFCMT